MLVRKHPKVAARYPKSVTDVLESGTFTDGQFDWVFLDSTVRLTGAQRAQVDRIARLAVIDVRDRAWGLDRLAPIEFEMIMSQATDQAA
jgi:hypothetical protein